MSKTAARFIDVFLNEKLGHFESIDPIFQGANNQGYKIKSNNKSYFLKAYPHSSSSSLQKLENEFSFHQLLASEGIKQVPRPIAKCSKSLIALYDYIEGDKKSVISNDDVTQALVFIKNINAPKIINKIQGFPNATEAPETLFDFINLVSNRIERHKEIKANSKADIEYKNFILLLDKRFQNIKENNVEINWTLKLNHTLLSPSDFGFHNALIHELKWTFIDFEYAGKDSPWKLIADFFCQPGYPIDLSYISIFLGDKLFSDIKNNLTIFRCIYELTCLKWCLIMLNEFLPEIQQRRKFSWRNSCLNKDLENKLMKEKMLQLQKSQLYFKNINNKLNDLDTAIKQF